MHVFRHHDRCVQTKPIIVAFQNALENCIASFRGEWLTSIVLAKSDEHRASCLQVMRHHASVRVHPGQRHAFGMNVLVWHGLCGSDILVQGF